ncbi:MAG: diguanylate cyclase (GGDEF)-like protein [Pseudohongiellaceae bacterium]
MTVHKFTVSNIEVDAEQEQAVHPYKLSQYLRRYSLAANSESLLHGGNTAVSNWGLKLRQQRHLAITLLIAMAIYWAFLSFDLLLSGQTLEGLALMVLMAVHVFVVWRQIRSKLNWPSQLIVAGSILALYSYLLLTGSELQGDVLWALTIAPAFFFLLGHFWGSVCFGLALAISITVFYEPSTLSSMITVPFVDGDYLSKERFLGMFMLLGMYSFLLEYDRSRVVGSLVDSRDRLKLQASTDELTGLANRHHMRECLSIQERRSYQRKERYGLILADIDRFKRINDQYGHDCGDYVISAVADALRSTLRDEDVVARWGGEEFLVVLPDSDGENAKWVAQKLREAVADLELAYGGQAIYPTLSFGVVSGDQHQKAQDLICQADHCLYQAKHKGRDCIVYA